MKTMESYSRVGGFGDEVSQFLDPVVDVEPPPPLNCKTATG